MELRALRKKVSEFVQLKTTSTPMPMDMVWVVDNSGSMAQEVAQVRANILKFVANVEAKSDLRISVLSTDSGAYGLSFDSVKVGNDFLQVKSSVGSFNLLNALTAASCAADQLTLAKSAESGQKLVPTKLCGKEVADVSKGGTEDRFLESFAGTLVDRLRPEAQKVFVFVSDDNAVGEVDASNFFNYTGFEAKLTHVYAFIGQEKKTGCAIARKGERYIELAAKTGGETFDICEEDWSANFFRG